MKAAVFHGMNDLRVDEVPRPRIDETEILVKVRAVAVCGTDNRIYRFGHFRIPTGTRRVLGHEVSGEVVEVGARVRDFAKGDRVAVAPNVGCGTCHLCVQGFHQLCPANEAFGITLDGGFEEYMKVPAFALGNVAKIPAAMGFEEATLIEPLSCVFNAYEAHRTVPGDTVCVIGAGPIGTLHVLMNKMAGGRIVVVDLSPPRLEAIMEAGADFVVNSAEVDLTARMLEITGGRGADVVITALSVPEMQQAALEIAGAHGRVCFFGGMPKEKENVTLNTNLIHYKELMVTATTGSSIQDFHNALRIIATGHLDVKSLITARFPLGDTVAAFDYASAGKGLKAVVVPDD